MSNSDYARAAGGQAGFGAARGAERRQALLVAAVVALQAPGQAVLDQPGGAVGALQAVAAGAATPAQSIRVTWNLRHS